MTTTTQPLVDFDVLPSALFLDHIGQAHFTGRLHADLSSGLTITAESWRHAWGRAADYQTVANARAVLAECERVAS